MPPLRLILPGSSEPTVREILAVYVRHSIANSVHTPAALADRERTFSMFCELHGDKPVSECKPFWLSDFVESQTTWRSTGTRRGRANYIGVRHRAASAAIAAGAPVKLVAQQLGHASVKTTERFYCSLEGEMDAIRDAFGRGTPKK